MLRITYCRREVDEDGSCQPYVKPSTLGGMGLFTKGKPCPIEYVLPLRMFILFGPPTPQHFSVAGWSTSCLRTAACLRARMLACWCRDAKGTNETAAWGMRAFSPSKRMIRCGNRKANLLHSTWWRSASIRNGIETRLLGVESWGPSRRCANTLTLDKTWTGTIHDTRRTTPLQPMVPNYSKNKKKTLVGTICSMFKVELRKVLAELCARPSVCVCVLQTNGACCCHLTV